MIILWYIKLGDEMIMKGDKIFPSNWQDTIRENKAIFYNTSVGNLLLNRERHIEKMKWVFKIFQEHPEVVLWWRPHPLEFDTIKCMAPELERSYVEMRKWYQDENVGILDESADLHRAIAISDAYYGDWSSVIQLYKITEKPILLSDDQLMDYSSEVAFFVTDFVIIDDQMWFISSYYTGLFRMNLVSFVIEEVIPIPGERIYEEGMMRFILQVDRELFLVPDWGNKVVAYDIDHRTMRKASIGERTTFSKCDAVYYRDGSLYLVSHQKKSQLKIDIKNFTVKSVEIEDIEIQNTSSDSEYIVMKTVNGKEYAFPRLENVMQVTDLTTGQSITKKMNIAAELKEVLCNRRLFDIYEGIEPSVPNPIYAGEHRWVHTLPRYIDAIVYGASEKNMVNKNTNLCGDKIYEVCNGSC